MAFGLKAITASGIAELSVLFRKATRAVAARRNRTTRGLIAILRLRRLVQLSSFGLVHSLLCPTKLSSVSHGLALLKRDRRRWSHRRLAKAFIARYCSRETNLPCPDLTASIACSEFDSHAILLSCAKCLASVKVVDTRARLRAAAFSSTGCSLAIW